MREPKVLELLFANYECYSHILQQIFLYLDSYTLKNLLMASKEMNFFVKRAIWRNSRAKAIMKNRLSKRFVDHHVSIAQSHLFTGPFQLAEAA